MCRAETADIKMHSGASVVASSAAIAFVGRMHISALLQSRVVYIDS